MSKSIDINCDMGESYGHFRVGNDAAIFPYISSSNIACGFHGGDPYHIEKTIQLALEHKVRIGAHPGYPDLAGFGRRKMELPLAELKAIVKYQVSALKGMTESLGGSLAYVKPHGALYGTAAKDEAIALTIIEAIREIDESLAFMGLAGSIMEEKAKELDRPFIAEAFADRAYREDGKLMSRSLNGAVIHDADKAVKQVLDLVQKEAVVTADGPTINVKAHSICIHGDNPGAVTILQAIEAAFQKEGIVKIAELA